MNTDCIMSKSLQNDKSLVYIQVMLRTYVCISFVVNFDSPGTSIENVIALLHCALGIRIDQIAIFVNTLPARPEQLKWSALF
jgi:hypothetical protein